MRWKRSALRLLVVVVALMTVAGALGPITATAAAEGQPEPPHRFFGTVTDANGDAVVGATVEVVYDGEVVEEATTDGNGYYDLTVAEPDSGEQVTLRVADTDASEEYAWESGGSTEHDFPDVQDPTDETETETTTTTTTTTTDDDDDSGDDSPGGSPGGAPSGGGGDGGSDTTTTVSTPDSTTEQGIQDPTTSETRQGEAPTTDATSTDSTVETETTDETKTETTTDDDNDSGIPGFGVSAGLVALVAAALLAVRRSRIDS